MTTYGALPSLKTATEEEERVHHGLLRFVREAVASSAALPGEVELAARLGVSRQQVRHALAELDRQGIVRRRQGAATTVDPVGLRMSVRLEEQYEHAELLSRMGYSSAVEVLASTVEPLSAPVAALLSADTAVSSLRVRKRWLADGVPAMVADDTIAVPAGVSVAAEESIFTAITRIWGEPIVWEVTTPGVASLDTEMAALFELPVGTAVMTLELIGVGASGRRLFYSFEYHHPDIVRYSLVRTVRPPWVTG
jgi:DNA-binding GntR family transcriptional regulator